MKHFCRLFIEVGDATMCVFASHEAMWPSHKVKKLQQTLDLEDVEGRPSNDKCRFKTLVRGGLIVEIMQLDKKAFK